MRNDWYTWEDFNVLFNSPFEILSDKLITNLCSCLMFFRIGMLDIKE